MQLFCEAREGNDKSLFHLFQYDSTLFDHEWVRMRLRKALYLGDVKFFDELAKTFFPLMSDSVHSSASPGWKLP